MSLKYLHRVVNESLKNGVKETYEEFIIQGEKGVTIKMFKKDADGMERIVISGKEDKYKMKSQKGDKKDEKDLTLKEMLAELKSNKALKFAAEFAKTQKGGKLFGGKKMSKKSSKTASKTASKKTSKKSSKKASKKSSKRGSKKN
jgi:hypothetical protein